MEDGPASSRRRRRLPGYPRQMERAVRKPGLTTKSGSKRRRQYAALPFRFTGDGKLQVLLLTSRETQRWLIPKGWPIPLHTNGSENDIRCQVTKRQVSGGTK